LLVTSPAPGDGKTTIASNLGIAMAQAGERVLVMDADFRRPMQHQVFGCGGTQGLSSVVKDGIAVEEAVVASEIENLYVLPCGPIPENPSEMLNSPQFKQLLTRLTSQFDRIVIDSPPVTVVTDARILGALCDLTLLVLRADHSARKPTDHTLDSLTRVGAKVLGVAVNDVPRRGGRYGYYYGGYYGKNYRYRRKGGSEREETSRKGRARHEPEEVEQT
jgi:capsular exopolysaccharide synthesis family protein